MKKILLALLFTLVTAGLFANATYAVDEDLGTGQALEIAPPLVSLRADPGQTVTADIKIRDIAKVPLVVTGEVNDFSSDGETGIPKIATDTTEKSPYSIIDWVQPLNQLTLIPGEIKSLPVEINVPSNASPGGYYGVIRFTAKAGSLNSSGVALSASLGALVFIRVNGDATESMEVEELYAQKEGKRGWFFDGSPITFVQRVKNTGNVQEQPVGVLAVADMFGKPVANLSFNLAKNTVLPDSIRRFETSLDKTNIGNRMLFGMYTGKLTTTFGDGQTVTKTVRIFVFPWQIVLGIIVALAAIIGGFRYWLVSHDRSMSGHRGNRSRRSTASSHRGSSRRRR